MDHPIETVLLKAGDVVDGYTLVGLLGVVDLELTNVPEPT